MNFKIYQCFGSDDTVHFGEVSNEMVFALNVCISKANVLKGCSEWIIIFLFVLGLKKYTKLKFGAQKCKNEQD